MNSIELIPPRFLKLGLVSLATVLIFLPSHHRFVHQNPGRPWQSADLFIRHVCDLVRRCRMGLLGAIQTDVFQSAGGNQT